MPVSEGKEHVLDRQQADYEIEQLSARAESHLREGNYAEAETLLWGCLRLTVLAFGAGDPRLAKLLCQLGRLYCDQDRQMEAACMYQRLLRVIESSVGHNDPRVADVAYQLALLYHYQDRYGQAERFYKQALAIRELTDGADHPSACGIRSCLAKLYMAQGKYQEAEPLYNRALAVLTRVFGERHSLVRNILRDYSLLLQITHRQQAGEFLRQCATN